MVKSASRVEEGQTGIASRCKKKKKELFTETARIAEKPILSYLVQVMPLSSGRPQRKTWDPHWQSSKWLSDEFF